jgi:hypothetical protein
MNDSNPTQVHPENPCATTPAPAGQPPASADLKREPSLAPLGRRQKVIHLGRYALREHWVQIGTMILAVLALAVGVSVWDVLSIPHADPAGAGAAALRPAHWAEWISRLQSFLGIGTLMVALFMWYGEVEERWEEALPNRLSVYFLRQDRKPAIVCRHVVLLSPADLRAWSQQVASQAAGKEQLDFAVDLPDRPAEPTLAPDGSVCRHYQLRFRLKKVPKALEKEPDTCLYQNLLAANPDVQRVSSKDVADLPDVAVWLSEHPKS